MKDTLTMTKELWQMSAAEQAQAIRAATVSSASVVRSHLDRIKSINPRINAVVRTLEDEAMRAADAADSRVANGEAVGPLHGVPVTIKENIDVAGTATTHGVTAHRDLKSSRDAPVVAHLKRAGAIPIGRTNLPDYGLRWHTDNDLYGATLNPWDRETTPGGSSGGDAVAVATGMTPLGIGNDMGGSIRYPAYCCGVTGIRPSLGRVSRIATAMFPQPPRFYEQVAAVNGPIARHVADLRIALRVMSRPDPADPEWTPAAWPEPDAPEPVRVAVTEDPGGCGVDDEVAAGIRRAADILSDAGYAVEAMDPPLVAESSAVIQRISDMEFADFLPQLRALVSDGARIFLDHIMGGTDSDLNGYMDAIGERHRIAAAWSRFLDDHTLVLGPVSTMRPFKVGYDIAGRAQAKRFVRSLELTELCNLIGLPSVAVPVQVGDGPPMGVQIIGPRFHEDACLDAAETIERSQGVFTPIDPGR